MAETNFQKSDVWINVSQSGAGFTIKIGDVLYTGAMQSLAKLVNGEIKGVNLSIAGPRDE